MAFARSRSLVIDHTKCGSSFLLSFPVIISLSDDDLKDVAHSGGVQSSSGYDIVFAVDSAGDTLLPWEIVSYDPVAGTLVAWVRVPSISFTENSFFYILYGDAAISTAQNTGSLAPAYVWDADYQAVLHLGDGTTVTGTDSTGLTPGTLVGAPTVDPGPTMGGAAFDGSSQYVTLAGSQSDSESRTFELWIKPSVRTGYGNPLLTVGPGGNADFWGVAGTTGDAASAGQYKMYVDHWGVGAYKNTSQPAISNDDWTHVVFTYSSINKQSAFYQNGVKYPFVFGSGMYNNNLSSAVVAGSNIGGSSTQSRYLGSLGELRISKVSRSDDWILVSYNNQSDPSAFLTLDGDTGVTPSTYTKYREIAIDHTKCGSSDSAFFPVLVSISDASFKTVANGGNVQNSDGYDIAFYNDSMGGYKLAWEVEQYDGANGILLAWVRVPVVSCTVDTVFYVFYGDSGISAAQNTGDCSPANVWANHYKLVQHFGDGSSLALTDSTGLNVAVTNHSASADAGQIHGAVKLTASSAQFVDEGNAAALQITSEISIGMWVKFVDASVAQFLFTKLTTVGGNNGYTVFVDASTIYFYLQSSGQGDSWYRSASLSSSVWIHVTGTMIFGRMQLYINGSLTAGSTDLQNQARITDSGAAACLGKDSRADRYYVNGLMDEVHIANVARSAGWVLAEFNNQNAPGNIGDPDFLTYGEETAIVGAGGLIGPVPTFLYE